MTVRDPASPNEERRGAEQEAAGADAHDAGVADRDIAALQAAVLDAVLNGTALHGGASVSLPDLAFLGPGAPALARENLAAALVDAPPPGVRLIDAGAPADARPAGYLRFEATRVDAGVLRIGLDVWHAPDRGGTVARPLGGVRLAFRRDADDAWRLDEPPQAFAT